jgi:hypothetical protein
MGMLDRETRQVRVRMVPNVGRKVLMDHILREVEGGSTRLTYAELTGKVADPHIPF